MTAVISELSAALTVDRTGGVLTHSKEEENLAQELLRTPIGRKMSLDRYKTQFQTNQR